MADVAVVEDVEAVVVVVVVVAVHRGHVAGRLPVEWLLVEWLPEEEEVAVVAVAVDRQDADLGVVGRIPVLATPLSGTATSRRRRMSWRSRSTLRQTASRLRW